MYDVQDYDSMFADAARSGPYLSAIQRAVKPGSLVVEIGTGVGYFAVAACRAGARRVYAIDLNPAVDIGTQLAADNGCADRIVFIRGDSRLVRLPEPGDVLLSDLRGVLPTYGEHIPTLVDARRRLVRPGATLIPRRDTMWAAPCVAPAEWRRDHVTIGDRPHGIDRRAVAARVRSDWYRARLGGDDLMAEGVEWAALDYPVIESANVTGRAEWTFARDAVVDGLALWFDGDLGLGTAISNAPSAPRTLYGQAFFPLERAIPVRPGDQLAVELGANLVNGDYVWAWNSTLVPCSPGARTVTFRQSNLAARIISPSWLRARSADHRPARGVSVTIWATMLALVDGSRSIGEIASTLCERHPDAFTDPDAAFRFVSARLGSLDDEEGAAFTRMPSTD